MSRSGQLLFDNLNLKLSPGSCLGLMGQNGSGKSTLLNLLKGDFSPDAGTIDRANNLRIVTFGQKREQLNQNQTLWQALAPDSDSVVYKGQTYSCRRLGETFFVSTRINCIRPFPGCPEASRRGY